MMIPALHIPLGRGGERWKLLFPVRGSIPGWLRWDGEGCHRLGVTVRSCPWLRVAAEPSPAAPGVLGAGTSCLWHGETPPKPVSLPLCHLCLLRLMSQRVQPVT